MDLNVRAKRVKLLEERIGVDLNDFGWNDSFLDIIPNTQSEKEKKYIN